MNEHRHNHHEDHEDGGHAGHSHGHTDIGTRALWIAVSINMLLTLAQIIGGALAGSLALVADALHNFNDAVGMGIALWARRIARRPADHKRSFGYRRAEVVAASVNLTALIVVALFLAFEGVMRFFEQRAVDGWIVVIIACIALAVDAGTAWLTWRHSKGSQNIRAVFIHNLADALASVAVIVAGVAIIIWEAYWIDLAITLLISAYILAHGLIEIRPVIQILMDGVPPGVDLEEVRRVCRDQIEGVEDVHHTHVWQIDEQHRAAEAHIVISVDRLPDMPRIKADLHRLLEDRFGIQHATLEFEALGEAHHLPGDHEKTVPRH